MLHCYVFSNHSWTNNSQILQKSVMGLGKAISRKNGNSGTKGEGTVGIENQTSQFSVFWKKMGEGRREKKKSEANICCFC